MEYLRNLGTAAASSLLQKSGIAYPFVLGDKISSFDGKTIWTLYDAVKRVSNTSTRNIIAKD
jgi:SCY1-like protein 1